jgi:hypothetical protein
MKHRQPNRSDILLALLAATAACEHASRATLADPVTAPAPASSVLADAAPAPTVPISKAAVDDASSETPAATAQGFLVAPGRGEDHFLRALPEGLTSAVVEAEEVTVQSLDPYARAILGSAPVPVKRRQEVLRILQQGVSASDGTAARCFEPRHGLIARVKGKILKLEICFQCRQIYVFDGGDEPYRILTSDTVEPKLDAFFRSVGLTKKAPRERD